MEFGFPTILWIVILVLEALLVTAWLVLDPGLVRLSIRFAMPALLILGGVINGIYNYFMTGNVLEGPPPRRRARP